MTGVSTRDARNLFGARRRAGSSTQKEDTVAEEVVRSRVQQLFAAIGARDLDRVLSFYAPDIGSFDLDPPLGYEGIDHKRRAWRAFFDVHVGPVHYEARDLRVTSRGDLAFARSLNHVSGTLAGGRSTAMWVRWTACFERIGGVWLVVHDHVSVPADLEHGRALTNLSP
jgi:ketosteroid isomerase-like protein